MLRIEHLDVAYGKVAALSEVTLEVATGSATAVLGANGAGKTTLLRAISGIVRPRGGNVLLDGRSLVGLAPAAIVKAGVAHVPEGRHVFSELTVSENLELGAYAVRSRAALSRLHDVRLRIFDLFPRLHERRQQAAGSLSGGEQQMLAIGRALMSLPGLLMLDEPTLGLSPILVQDIYRAIAELRRDGITVLTVEQNVGLVRQFTEAAYVLANGRVVGSGSVAELISTGVLKAAYLGAGPSVNADRSAPPAKER